MTRNVVTATWKAISLFSLLFACLVMTGCQLMLRSGDLPRVQQWPLDKRGNLKTITIVADGTVTINQASLHRPGDCQLCSDMVMRPIGEAGIRQAEKAYVDSGLFAIGMDTAADLHAEIETSLVRDYFPKLGILSSFTLGIVPSYSRYSTKIVTVFKSPSGAILGTVEKSERYSSWLSPLLLPFAPFLSLPKDFHNKVLYDLHRATLEEAVAHGII